MMDDDQSKLGPKIERSKIEIMIVKIEVVNVTGEVFDGPPLAYKCLGDGSASECFRYFGDRFHLMAREDEALVRRLKKTEETIIKQIQNSVWGKAGKA